MPTGRGLDQETTERLKRSLRTRHAALLDRIRLLRRAATAGADRAGADQSDRAVATNQDELDATRLDRLSGELVALEAALSRLSHGEYGFCDDCGEFIGLIRLQALPLARRCRDCQSRTESKTNRARPLVRVADFARPD